MAEPSSQSNNIYNPCLYPSNCGQQMIGGGEFERKKRTRENDKRPP